MTKQYKPIGECQTVRDLLEDPKRWCKGSFARDAQGEGVSIYNNMACSWCLVGALEKIYPHLYAVDFRKQLLSAIKNHYKIGEYDIDSISIFNDNVNTTHDDMLAVITEAGI